MLAVLDLPDLLPGMVDNTVNFIMDACLPAYNAATFLHPMSQHCSHTSVSVTAQSRFIKAMSTRSQAIAMRGCLTLALVPVELCLLQATQMAARSKVSV